MATDNAKLVEELRKTHDRLLCQVADDGTRIKNEADYQADAEVALDVCWRAATALASAEALNERLVSYLRWAHPLLEKIFDMPAMKEAQWRCNLTAEPKLQEGRALLASIEKG